MVLAQKRQMDSRNRTQNRKSAELSAKHVMEVAFQISWGIMDYWGIMGTVSESAGEEMEPFTPMPLMDSRGKE